MKKTHWKRAGTRLSLVLLSVFILLILLASAASSQQAGDVNFDGNVDIYDVILVQKHILGHQPPLTSAQLTAADVNRDGVVNVVDANLMMQYIQGYIKSFPTHSLHTPVLISPVEGASIDGSIVSFQWGAVTGATRYQLEITKVTDGTLFRTVDLGNFTSTTQYAFANDGAQYRWRVRAGTVHAWGAWTAYRNFTSGVVLPAPTLSSPANKSTISGTSVLFRWNQVSGATKYQLHVFKGTENVSFKDVTVGNIAMSEQFGFQLDGATYSWRVRAGNNTGWGAWSGDFTFGSDSMPAAPTLTSPAAAATVVGTQVSFQWNAVGGATMYELEIFNDNNGSLFSRTLVNNATVSMQRGFLNDGTEYKWRVKAASREGWGLWSDFRYFTNGNPPTAPVLIKPADNENIYGNRVMFEWRPVPGADKYQLQIKKGTQEPQTLDVGYAFAWIERDLPNDGSVYQWRVWAGNVNGGNWSAWRTFTNGSKYAFPVLLSPPAYSSQIAVYNDFCWQAVEGATKYHLEVLDYVSGAIFASKDDIVNTTHRLEGFVPTNHRQYKWRVRAGSGSEWGLWSAYRYFISQNIVNPAAPFLLSPASGATATGGSLTFTWTDTGASTYRLQVLKVPGGDIIIDESAIPVNRFTSVDDSFPDDGTTFIWRVRARNGSWGAWSFYRTFTNGSYWWNFSF